MLKGVFEGECKKMIDVGRVCVKLAGRDAGKRCVIVEVMDKNFVLIDGETRRRKCNISHLEPLKDVVKIKKGASHNSVKEVLDKMEVKVMETNPKPKMERPRKVRKKKVIDEKEEKKKGKKKEKDSKEKAIDAKAVSVKKEKVVKEKVEKKK